MTRFFRKRPVVITACQYVQGKSEEVLRFTSGQATWDDVVNKGTLVIHTLEGTMTVSVGDWVIRGVQGEYYPCKPDIFAATYEEVQQPQAGTP